MTASWCQGLAGIGTAMVKAASLLSEDRYVDLARESARACLAVAPRMPVVSQCCGLAGVGELLIDLAETTGEANYLAEAEYVLSLMLNRAGGDPSQPSFPDHSLMRSSGQWGVGSAGVLSFLRRLRQGGGPRLLTASWDPRLVALRPMHLSGAA
jgi:lantibiotic modifying enzyme